jgi:DNA-binding transcriptional regulator YiaG
MTVEILWESVQPDGQFKIVQERHRFGFSKFDIELSMSLQADGTWAMSDNDTRDYRAGLFAAKQCGRGLPTPQQVKAARLSLKLTQRRASKLFGGGPRSFQKIESGAQLPGMAFAKLLWLVSRAPELLFELEGYLGW